MCLSFYQILTIFCRNNKTLVAATVNPFHCTARLRGLAGVGYGGSSKQRVEIAVIFKLSSLCWCPASRYPWTDIHFPSSLCVSCCTSLSCWSNNLTWTCCPLLIKYIYIFFSILKISVFRLKHKALVYVYGLKKIICFHFYDSNWNKNSPSTQKPGMPVQCKQVLLVIYTRNLLCVSSLMVLLQIFIVYLRNSSWQGGWVAGIIIILMQSAL